MAQYSFKENPIKATSIEEGFLEVALRLQLEELKREEHGSIQLYVDTDRQKVMVNAEMDATFSTNKDGNLVVHPVEYLSD